ncbi:hypothetical protein [Paenibacillus sp. J2TS4]|uniref:hypothetical protein n=1 Tax=Paenibacillus sp. J2TS4 TaxID=2807194 RepID=UPI001B0F3EDB|nr:hypothetical protein [Paenibacillus sp. J2TS4]GIP33631.1 hypothetical protein J2TS4_28410 [Paenibacillus sp. J2TS4]
MVDFHHYMEDISGARHLHFSSLLGRKPFHLFHESIDLASAVIIKRLTQSVQTCGIKNLELECNVLELLFVGLSIISYRVEASGIIQH